MVKIIFSVLAALLVPIIAVSLSEKFRTDKIAQRETHEILHFRQKTPRELELAKLWEECCIPVPPPLESVTAENFSFKNYGADRAEGASFDRNKGQRKALNDALQKIFPVGTSKDFFENTLIARAGAFKVVQLTARIPPSNHPASMLLDHDLYGHDIEGFSLAQCQNSWLVGAQFDQNQKLKYVSLGTFSTCGMSFHCVSTIDSKGRKRCI